MPLALDIVTRLVNVHWKEIDIGGFFAVSTEQIDEAQAISGKIFGGTVGPKKEAETDGAIDSSWSGVHAAIAAYRCQSYALVNGEQTHYDNGAIIEKGGKPTFVIGGHWVGFGEIKISHNGKNWTTATTQEEPSEAGTTGFSNIVWDATNRAFYAMSDFLFNADAYAQGQIWRSSDGNSWSKIAEATAMVADDYDVNIPPLEAQFLTHCTKPENRVGVGISDGFAGFDYTKGILMYPTGAGRGQPTIGGGSNVGTSITIEFLGSTDTPGDASRQVSLPVDLIFGVAWAGGTWCAFGFDTSAGFENHPFKVFASIDNGETWENVHEAEAWRIYGIIGGAMSDIEKETA
jgi:hypothetical protein